MMKYLVPFLLSSVLCLILTPMTKRLSLKVGAIDRPNSRKIHNGGIPRLGGVAIYLAFFITAALFLDSFSKLEGFFYGSTVILIIGLIDDIKGLRAKTKLAGQILAALIMVSFNIEVEFLTNLFNGILFLGYLSIPVTVFWVVGLINSVNLIDGMDGLAGGVSFIAAISMAFIALSLGRTESAVLAFVLAGSVLGFLKYNFNPADVFMGDTGSMFLGYSLAAIAVLGTIKSLTVISFLVPVIILGVPIMDTGFAILRRLIKGNHPFKADKQHMHHRFLELGLNQRQTVLSIYLISLIFGISAILLAQLASAKALLLISVVLTVVFFWLKEFKIIELEKENVFNCLNILTGIKTEMEVIDDELGANETVPELNNELEELERILNRLPSYVGEEEASIATAKLESREVSNTKIRVSLLSRIIGRVINLYEREPENINYVFEEEKEKLLEIHDNIKRVS